MCLAIAAGGLVWSALLKIVAQPRFFESVVELKEEPLTEEEQAQTLIGVVRKQTSTAQRR